VESSRAWSPHLYVILASVVSPVVLVALFPQLFEALEQTGDYSDLEPVLLTGLWPCSPYRR